MKDLDKPIHKSKKFLAVMLAAAMLGLVLVIRVFGFHIEPEIELVIAGAYAAAINAAVAVQGLADARGASRA